MVVKNLLRVLWERFIEENEEPGPRTIANDVSVKTMPSQNKETNKQTKKERKCE
jgi:hypothetical protein